MEVQPVHQAPVSHASRNLFNKGYPTYPPTSYTDQFNSSLHDEDSHGSHRSSPLNCSNSSQHENVPVYNGFYKTIHGNFQTHEGQQQQSQHQKQPMFQGYNMDYNRNGVSERDTDSPGSQQGEHDALHIDQSYPRQHTVTGGLVGAPLDSEGSSVNLSCSDNASDTSDGHQHHRSHSPQPAQRSGQASPMSSTHSEEDHQTFPVHANNAQQRVLKIEPQMTPPQHTSDEVNTPPKTPENQSEESPSSDTTGSAKKRQCSPNLHKIEAVINSLRTAKAKKKEKKESPTTPSQPVPVAAQYPSNDPRNLWAMYALSQYAMMAPGGANSAYYPYHQGDNTAAMYRQYQSMMHNGMSSGQYGKVESLTASPGKRKRDSDEEDTTPEDARTMQSGSYMTPNYHAAQQHSPVMRTDQPLDFSKPSNTPPQRSTLPEHPHSPSPDNTGRYSPSQAKNRKRSPASKPKNRMLKEEVVTEHGSLWEELKELSLTSSRVKIIIDDYQKSVDDFETERYQALLDNISSEQCKDAVHAYFNHERLQLVKKTRADLTVAKKQDQVETAQLRYQSQMMGHPQTAAPFSHSVSSPFTSVASTMGASPLATYPYASALYGLASSVPQPAPAAVPNFGAYSPMASYMATAMADDAAVMYGQNPEETDNSSKRKFLTQEAVNALQVWYDKNEEHPYPDEETVEDLAREAKVTVPQVKKWMANKRVRSSNTLAFNGSIHPKKIQKLIQLKEMAESRPTPANASPVAQHTPEQSTTPAQVKARNVSGKKNKRLLDPSAVAYMTQWYTEHIMYPYPTDEEKNKIADDCNLTVSQVTCWFANKRNRSNHSRKHSMGMERAVLAQKMTVYDSVKQENPQETLNQ